MTTRTELTVDNSLIYLKGTVACAFEANSYQALLCYRVLADPAFRRAPGSKGKHQAHPGGLLLHTAQVVQNCVLLGGRSFKWDVLLVAAIWHDFMKTREYVIEGQRDDLSWIITSTEYRDRIGHVTGSVLALQEEIIMASRPAARPWLDEVIHCMLAHHGRLEWRSPVEPASAEAGILHLADMMSARDYA